jgi:hypothetical protein
MSRATFWLATAYDALASPTPLPSPHSRNGSHHTTLYTSRHCAYSDQRYMYGTDTPIRIHIRHAQDERHPHADPR